MKNSNTKIVLFVLIIFIMYYQLFSLNATFKDYTLFSLALFLLIGCCGLIFKEIHYKKFKTEKSEVKVKDNFNEINLN